VTFISLHICSSWCMVLLNRTIIQFVILTTSLWGITFSEGIIILSKLVDADANTRALRIDHLRSAYSIWDLIWIQILSHFCLVHFALHFRTEVTKEPKWMQFIILVAAFIKLLLNYRYIDMNAWFHINLWPTSSCSLKVEDQGHDEVKYFCIVRL